jgi:hypothetical protein
MLRFVAVGARATFSGLGELPGVGLALALVLLVGVPLAYSQLGRDGFRRFGAAPIALLVGAAVFFLIASFGRAGPVYVGGGGPEYARESRYVYISAAMAVPALAFAANAVGRRWRALGAVVLLLPILGVPGNLHAFNDFREGRRLPNSARSQLLLAPRLPMAAQLPRSTEPSAFLAPGVTLGWLIEGVHSHRVPAPPPTTPQDRATLTLQLALVLTSSTHAPPCSTVAGPVRRVLQSGESVTFETRQPVSVRYRTPKGTWSRSVTRSAGDVGGRTIGDAIVARLEAKSLTLVARAGPLPLRIVAPTGTHICG